MGLSVTEIGDHRVHVDGRALSAWYAWDTLFLPELLGRTAGVTSRCPITGEAIWLTVGLAGVADLHPAETVVLLMLPDNPLGGDVIRSFCTSCTSSPQSNPGASGRPPTTEPSCCRSPTRVSSGA